MAVEIDLQTDGARIVDDLVQALQRGESLQVGVGGEVDTRGGGSRSEHLLTEGNPQGVEPERDHLIEEGVIIPLPESMHDLVAGFESEPVDSADHHVVTVGIHDLVSLGGEVAG